MARLPASHRAERCAGRGCTDIVWPYMTIHVVCFAPASAAWSGAITIWHMEHELPPTEKCGRHISSTLIASTSTIEDQFFFDGGHSNPGPNDNVNWTTLERTGARLHAVELPLSTDPRHLPHSHNSCFLERRDQDCNSIAAASAQRAKRPLKFAALRSPINPLRRAETNTNVMASLSSHAPEGYDPLGYRMWESFQQVQDLNIESMLF
jgi:hypothetical protein